MTGGDSLTEDLNLYYNAGDIAWMITSTALVLLMIPGVGYAIPSPKEAQTHIDCEIASSILVLLDASPLCHSFGCRSPQLVSFPSNGSSGVIRSPFLTRPASTSVTWRTLVSAMSSVRPLLDPRKSPIFCLRFIRACSLQSLLPSRLVLLPKEAACYPPWSLHSSGRPSSTTQLPAGHGTLPDGHSTWEVSTLLEAHLCIFPQELRHLLTH